ncbi:hypothetical protein MMC2321_02937 [Chitinophaga sp. MM2321]
MELCEKEKITPQQAIQILQKDGIVTNQTEAKIILDFLYIIAEIVVDTYLENSD